MGMNPCLLLIAESIPAGTRLFLVGVVMALPKPFNRHAKNINKNILPIILKLLVITLSKPITISGYFLARLCFSSGSSSRL